MLYFVLFSEDNFLKLACSHTGCNYLQAVRYRPAHGIGPIPLSLLYS